MSMVSICFSPGYIYDTRQNYRERCVDVCTLNGYCREGETCSHTSNGAICTNDDVIDDGNDDSASINIKLSILTFFIVLLN